MQCLQLTCGDAPSTGVTVTLSGTFSSAYAYVTIGGTKYTSAQTLTVEKGTKVTVTAGFRSTSYGGYARIYLNGTKISDYTSTTSRTASYAFNATDNCKIVLNATGNYGTAEITMPA